MTQTQTPRPSARPFTRMDESTAEQWAVIGKETVGNQGRVADRVLGMLRSLAEITDGFAVDQLTHSLQTATLAERAGADEEMVFASLLPRHRQGRERAEPPARSRPRSSSPYVRADVYKVIRAHQDFQGRHYYHHFGGDPNARDAVRGRAVVRRSPRSSPTSGTRSRSTPTTTRCRSSTSSRCVRQVFAQGRF